MHICVDQTHDGNEGDQGAGATEHEVDHDSDDKVDRQCHQD